MIFTLTLNPCLDRYLYIDDLIEDDTVRVKKVSDYPAGKGIDVSRVINELGGHSVAIALLGGHTGQIIQKMLNEEGVRLRFGFHPQRNEGQHHTSKGQHTVPYEPPGTGSIR